MGIKRVRKMTESDEVSQLMKVAPMSSQLIKA